MNNCLPGAKACKQRKIQINILLSDRRIYQCLITNDNQYNKDALYMHHFGCSTEVSQWNNPINNQTSLCLSLFTGLGLLTKLLVIGLMVWVKFSGMTIDFGIHC